MKNKKKSPNSESKKSNVIIPASTEDSDGSGFKSEYNEYGVNTIIPDLYKVEDEPIKGGMGIVYKVRHTGWNVNLAMKQPYVFLKSDNKNQTEIQNQTEYKKKKKSFISECDKWINLGFHPHIATCYYVRNIGGILSIFAEWMEGGNLTQWIGDVADKRKRNGRLYEGNNDAVLERILDISIQTIWGLRYAYLQKKLIHCDVKPDNILLTDDGTAKIADFGIAKAILLDDDTKSGCTIPYCSPEQKYNGNITFKTDLWSWSISVLEMFVGGRRWNDGVDAGLNCEKYFKKAYIPIPETMKDLLRYCFQENQDERPADYNEIVKILLKIYGESGKKYTRAKPQSVAETASKLNNKALTFLDLEKFEEAEKCWEHALKIDPGHSECLYNRSVYLWKRNKIDDAEAIRLLASNMINPDYYLAKLHITRWDTDSAIECLNRAKELYGPTDKIEILQTQVQEMIEKKLNSGCISTIEAHSKGINCLCLSPDMKRILSAGKDYSIKLWDFKTKKCLHPFNLGYPKSIKTVCFSPDGNMALFGGGNTFEMELWDLDDPEKEKIIRKYGEHSNDINEVCFSSDGKKALSGSSDGTIKLWNVDSGECEYTLEGHMSGVTSVCFSADDTKIISGGGNCSVKMWGKKECVDSSVKVWDIKEIECVRSFKKHTKSIESVRFSPNALTILSGSCDGTMKLYDVSQRKVIHSFEGHSGPIYSVCFNRDGSRAFSGSKDGTMKIWNTRTGACIRTFEAGGAVHSVCFSSKGVLTGDSNGKIKLWRLPKADPSFEMILSDIHSTELTAGQTRLFFSLVYEIESIVKDENISTALIKLEKLRAVRSFGNSDIYFSVIRVISQFCILGNKIINQATKKINLGFSIRSFCLTPDGKNVLLGPKNWDKPVEMCDLSTGQSNPVFKNNTHPVCSICCNPNGKYALSGSLDNNIMQSWDIKTGKDVKEFPQTGSAKMVCFSPDSKFAASIQDHIIKLWDVSSGAYIRPFNGHTKQINSFCFSPDGKYILSGGADNNLKLWNCNSGTCIKNFKGHDHEIVSVCFSPNGHQVLSGSWDKKVILWDIFTGMQLRTIEIDNGNVGMACISPDGFKVLVVDKNNPVMSLWDLHSGSCIHVFEGQADKFISACFNADGTKIISSNGKAIFVYDIEYELSFPEWSDWDEGARPFLEIFLKLHPDWTDYDAENFIAELRNRGYGWLRSRGVKTQLKSYKK